MLGAWNKLIFVGLKVAPAVLAHFAARTSVRAQQTEEQVEADRPSNLWKPADSETDHGASGSFGDQQGGFLNPKFLVTLPSTAVDIAGAVIDASRFRLKRTARSKQLR